jgi:hypothetical protein
MRKVDWREVFEIVKQSIGNESCERFSFYGMHTILMMFLVSSPHITPSAAVKVTQFHRRDAACLLG